MKLRTLTTCRHCLGSGKVERFSGAALRSVRERKRIGLRELARRLGVSAAHISDIENGKRFPSKELETAITEGLESASKKEDADGR